MILDPGTQRPVLNLMFNSTNVGGSSLASDVVTEWLGVGAVKGNKGQERATMGILQSINALHTPQRSNRMLEIDVRLMQVPLILTASAGIR